MFRFRRPSHAVVVAYLAPLRRARGQLIRRGDDHGRADIGNRSLTGADVRDRSLLASEFKLGQIPAGPQGPQGATGADGPAWSTATAVSDSTPRAAPDATSNANTSITTPTAGLYIDGNAIPGSAFTKPWERARRRRTSSTRSVWPRTCLPAPTRGRPES